MITFTGGICNMDELFKQVGFESEIEFHRLVAAADLSTPEKVQAFKAWQNNDGTKAGLLKLEHR